MLPASYAAGLQPCSMLPMLQQTSHKWRYCSRLPMLLGAPSMLLAYNNAACSLCCTSSSMLQAARGSLCCLLTTMHAPMLLAYNNAACSLCCTSSSMLQAANRGNTALQVAPYNAARGSLYPAAANMWRYRTRLPMLLAYNNAACSLCCTSSSMLQADNIWRYRTANGSQRQRCCLASGSLYAAPMLQSLALCCRLPTVAIPHCKWLPTMLHEAPSILRLPTCGDTARGSLCCSLTTMQHAPYAALLVQCCRLTTYGDTALRMAPNGNAAA
jgi:predicted DCC family thiol-disulfide oxidoreductase YuxK